MRLYRFDQVPFGLWYDEAENGLEALKILNQSGYLPVFVQTTALPAHFNYLIALSFQVLGRFGHFHTGGQCIFWSGNGRCGIFSRSRVFRPEEDGLSSGIFTSRISLGYQLESDWNARCRRSIL